MQIVEFLKVPNINKKFDDLFDYSECLLSLPMNTRVQHNVLKSLFLVSWRDFVYVSHCILYPDGKIVLGAKSIEFEACPPTDFAVRGDIEVAGWILEPYEGGTMATYIT